YLSCRTAAGTGRGANVLVELRLLVRGVLVAAFGHSVVVGDQVDEDTDPWDHHDKHRPGRLGPAGQVAPAEDVDQHRDGDPDEDHPGEKDQRRPEDVEERI